MPEEGIPLPPAPPSPGSFGSGGGYKADDSNACGDKAPQPDGTELNPRGSAGASHRSLRTLRWAGEGIGRSRECADAGGDVEEVHIARRVQQIQLQLCPRLA